MAPALVRKALSTFAIGVLVGGCVTWQAAGQGQLEVTPRDVTPTVRITRLDGARVELEKPELNGDSVVGFVPGFISCDARVAIPLEDVGAMEERRVKGPALAPLWALLGAVLSAPSEGTLEGPDLPGELRSNPGR